MLNKKKELHLIHPNLMLKSDLYLNVIFKESALKN